MSMPIRLVIIVLLFTSIIKAEILESTQHLSIEDGLSHNDVSCMLQDSRGYIWIGTYDGLNKYDGYSFDVYKNNIGDKFLTSNRISVLAEDFNGNIWIGTEHGLTIYKFNDNQFVDLDKSSGEEVGYFGDIVGVHVLNETNRIVCYNKKGRFYYFDRNCLLIESVDINLNGAKVTGGAVMGDENLLICTRQGLYHVESNDYTINPVLSEQIKSCHSIAELNDNRYAVCIPWGVAFFEVNSEGKEKEYTYLYDHFQGGNYQSVVMDMLGNLWIGSSNKGIVKLDSLAYNYPNKILDSEYSVYEENYLSISCFLVTEELGCWAGSHNNGIYRFNLKDNPFRLLSIEKNLFHDFGMNNLYDIAQPSHQIVFLTPRTGGSALLDIDKMRLEPLIVQAENVEIGSLSIDHIDSIGYIWGVIHGRKGYFRFHPDQREIAPVFGLQETTLAYKGARQVKQDNFGCYWLAAEEGLFRIEVDSLEQTITEVEMISVIANQKVDKIANVRCLFFDSDENTLWFGTNRNGLGCLQLNRTNIYLNPDLEVFLHNPNDSMSIPSNYIVDIIKASDGNIWIGTEGGGICRVFTHEGRYRFQSFNELNGLSNNVVKRIVEADRKLWVTTNIGLNTINLKDYKINQYRMQDGLPFEDFSNATTVLHSGEILLSGSGGIICLNPKYIPENKTVPKLHLGSLKIGNDLINPGVEYNSRLLLENQLALTDMLNLKYNENSITIKIDFLHFGNPNNYQVQYKLHPVDAEWRIMSANQKDVSFNALKSGRYVLAVRGATRSEQYTELRKINIVVNPPWWNSIAAKIVYLLLLIGVAYLSVKAIVQIKTLHYNLRIEHLEKEKADAINHEKLRYFSNISHEIKTPLSLILGPINSIIESSDKIDSYQLKKKLQIVKRQANNLEKLIDQVHDFQRSDVNKLVMNYNSFHFAFFLDKVIRDFKFKAEMERKNLLIIRPESDKCMVLADMDKVEKILNNLVSNAFKYTNSGDSIEIKYFIKSNRLHIQVKDSGIGISEEDLPNIFERFYQSKRSGSNYIGGAGIGLAFTKRLVSMHNGDIKVESMLGHGATFYIELPMVGSSNFEESTEFEKKILLAESSFNDWNFELPNSTDNIVELSEEVRGKLIYYVEDNAELRSFVTGTLNAYFSLRSFSNGKECLEALETEWPDLILSDVLMPEINGLELCRIVKSDLKTNHIPVILLTACTTESDEISGLKFGADAYVRKPFKSEYLLAQIESNLLGRIQLRKRLMSEYPWTFKKSGDTSKNDEFLINLTKLLEENINNPEFDFESTYKMLYIGRSVFFKKVKAVTGRTPRELLNHVRIQRAAELLANRKYNVNEVMTMIGYKSRSHFISSFKAVYKITPGKYAEHIRKETNRG